MVAYSFQARFAPSIDANEKLQTVRADRKRHARPGETLQLYRGMRTKHCHLVGVRQCASVHPILIDVAADLILVGLDYLLPAIDPVVYGHEGVEFKAVDLDAFAKVDGFTDWKAMKLFWSDAHPLPAGRMFKGVVICWTPGPAQSEGTCRAAGLDAALAEIGVL